LVTIQQAISDVLFRYLRRENAEKMNVQHWNLSGFYQWEVFPENFLCIKFYFTSR